MWVVLALSSAVSALPLLELFSVDSAPATMDVSSLAQAVLPSQFAVSDVCCEHNFVSLIF